MLEIRDLSLSVPTVGGPVPAVTGVSLSLERGRVLGLVGESGCGKSLTAHAILRLGEHHGVDRVGGGVAIDGDDLFAMDERALRAVRGGRVAMVFQEPMTALNPVFSVGDQLTEVIRIHLPLDRKAIRARAVQLLADVGLEEGEALLDRYPDALSGGMRQRVLIAMALAADPDYVVADEPTTALDVSVQARIIRLLRRLQTERGLGMLLVTHDFGLVAELADDVAVMYAGHIVERGSAAQLFARPSHPYTGALMACRPEVAEPGEPLPAIPGQVPTPGHWPAGCRFAPRCPWADAACESPVDFEAWRGSGDHAGHVARCIHVDRYLTDTAEGFRAA